MNNIKLKNKEPEFSILLANPLEDKYCAKFESLGLNYLASVLENSGFNVKLIRNELNGLSIENKARYISSIYKNPKIIGFTVFDSTYLETIEIIKELRNFRVNSHIILGGHFATLCYEKILKNNSDIIDSICIGEGELTLKKLAIKLKNGEDWKTIDGLAFFNSEKNNVSFGKPRKLIENLDEIPFPKRFFFGKDDNYRTVLSSRGCPYNCSFCTIPTFYNTCEGPKWRARTPKKIIEEIIYLINNFDVKHITFADDTFFGSYQDSNKRAIEIFRQIKRQNIDITFGLLCRVDGLIENEGNLSFLRNNGLVLVGLGIESGVQRSLNTLNKGTTVEMNYEAVEILKNLDIDLEYGFMMFDPYTTLQEVYENIQFLKKVKKYTTRNLCNRCLVFPNTPIAIKLEKEGRIKDNFPYYNYKIEDPDVEYLSNISYQIFQKYFDIDYKIMLSKVKLASASYNYNSDHLKKILGKFRDFEKKYELFTMNAFEEIIEKIDEVREIERNMDIEIKEYRNEIRDINSEIQNYYHELSS